MKIDELNFQDLALCAEAPPTAIDFLKTRGKLIYLRPRQILYKEGTPATDVFIILHGGLKVQKNHSKDLTIFDFITRGGLGGYLYNLEQTKSYMFTGVVLEHTRVLVLPIKDFEEFLQNYPSCNRYVQMCVGRFMNDMQQDRSMAKAQVSYRLAQFLLNMLDRQDRQSGLPFNRCQSILLKLSRQDIADRIGTKSETVIRILKLWEEMNILETRNKIITLKERAFLESFLNKENKNENEQIAYPNEALAL